MKTNKESKEFKVYVINRMNKLKKLITENNNKKDWLTVTEVIEEFNISRKTFDRLREKGLQVSQPKKNGKILVERRVLIDFLNK